VCTEIIPDAKTHTLQAIIRGQADIESVIHTDGWRGYDGSVDIDYEKHFRISHGEREFSTGNGNHMNGTESFWGFAKRRLAKFKGIPKEKFEIHIKKTEFCFNLRSRNFHHILPKEFREYPLK
jgi:transposase-like protein